MDPSSPPPEPREDRGPRIPPAKLSTIKPEPTISIFYKPTKFAALQLLDGKFSQDAAMVFCDRIRRELLDNEGTKSFTVTGGDVTGLTEVLAWIKQCVAEGSIVKYKDLGDAPNLFTSYANVISSAAYLGIPARDLAEGLTKRMQGIARKVLMSWEEVEWFYSSPSLKACGDPVREVAAASVFWAWWTHKLDDDETPDDMKFLDVLRREIPKLDQDLHDWCERNEQEVRKKWEDKKNGRAAAESAGGDRFGTDGLASGGGGGTGWNEAPTASAAIGGGWDETPSSAAAKGGDWDTGDSFVAQDTFTMIPRAEQATRGWEVSRDSSSGNDSAIDVRTGATSPAFQGDKLKSTGFDLDGPEHNGHAAGTSRDRNAASAGEFGDDMGEGGGDWADEVNQNQHGTIAVQTW